MKKYVFICFCIITTLYSMENDNNALFPFIFPTFTVDIDPELFVHRIQNFETKLLPLAKNKTLSKIEAFFPHLETDFEALIDGYKQEQQHIARIVEIKRCTNMPIFHKDKKTTMQREIEKSCAIISQKISRDVRVNILNNIWASFSAAKNRNVLSNRDKAIGIISLTVFLDYIIQLSSGIDENNKLTVPPYHCTGVHLAALQSMTKCIQCAKWAGVRINIKDANGRPAIAFINKITNPITHSALCPSSPSHLALPISTDFLSPIAESSVSLSNNTIENSNVNETEIPLFLPQSLLSISPNSEE